MFTEYAWPDYNLEVDISRLLYEIKQVKLYVTAALCSNAVRVTPRILQHDWLCDGAFLYAVTDHTTERWTEQMSVCV